MVHPSVLLRRAWRRDECFGYKWLGIDCLNGSFQAFFDIVNNSLISVNILFSMKKAKFKEII